MTATLIPPDLARRRFTWCITPNHGWTTPEFRAPVILFLVGLEHDFTWIKKRSLVVTERFATVDAREAFVGPPAAIDLSPRTRRAGIPILVFRVTRERDGQNFEVALSFPQGADTLLLTQHEVLGKARKALLVQTAGLPQ